MNTSPAGIDPVLISIYVGRFFGMFAEVMGVQIHGLIRRAEYLVEGMPGVEGEKLRVSNWIPS